jgi:hypothetical protein
MRKTLVLLIPLCLVVCTIAVVQPAQAQGQCDGPVDTDLCIWGFSKSWCGSVSDGDWGVFNCSDCIGREVLKGFSAQFDGQLVPGTGQCVGPTGKIGYCDDGEYLNGTLRVDALLNSVRGITCPGRGSWGGTWTLFDGSLLAQGRMDATLGVGTHRPSECGSCGTNCEGCYDATFDGAVTWTLGTEGFMQGEVLVGDYAGCRIRASFQGDMDANGDLAGPLPLPPSGIWGDFCMTIDGVLECPCLSGK